MNFQNEVSEQIEQELSNEKFDLRELQKRYLQMILQSAFWFVRLVKKNRFIGGSIEETVKEVEWYQICRRYKAVEHAMRTRMRDSFSSLIKISVAIQSSKPTDQWTIAQKFKISAVDFYVESG